jgi:hypothetical protein
MIKVHISTLSNKESEYELEDTYKNPKDIKALKTIYHDLPNIIFVCITYIILNIPLSYSE